MPATETREEKVPESKEKEKEKGKGEGANLSKTATLIVSLPADAKLTIDGNPTTSTSATRVFNTPDLDRGVEYFYTLQAEVTRDGQTQKTTKQVTVRAGQETRAVLEFPTAGVVRR